MSRAWLATSCVLHFAHPNSGEPTGHWQRLDGDLVYTWKPCVWSQSSVALETARFKFIKLKNTNQAIQSGIFASLAENPPTLCEHFYGCNITVLLQMAVTQGATKVMFSLSAFGLGKSGQNSLHFMVTGTATPASLASCPGGKSSSQLLVTSSPDTVSQYGIGIAWSWQLFLLANNSSLLFVSFSLRRKTATCSCPEKLWVPCISMTLSCFLSNSLKAFSLIWALAPSKLER